MLWPLCYLNGNLHSPYWCATLTIVDLLGTKSLWLAVSPQNNCVTWVSRDSTKLTYPMGSPGKSPRAIQSRVYSVCRYSCTVIINHLRERHLRFQFPCTTLYPGRLNGVTQSNIWSTCYLWIPPRHLYYTNGTQLPSCRTSPPPLPAEKPRPLTTGNSWS